MLELLIAEPTYACMTRLRRSAPGGAIWTDIVSYPSGVFIRGCAKASSERLLQHPVRLGQAAEESVHFAQHIRLIRSKDVVICMG